MLKDSTTTSEIQGRHPSLLDKSFWMEAVLADPELTQSAKNVAVRLALHHNVRTGQCNPTLPTLAKGIGIKPRATHTALTVLRDAGYVSWVAQKDGRSSYTLERITIGQVPAKVQGPAKASEPLHETATPLARDCKADPCTRLQTNPGTLNPGKNSVYSDAQEGTGTQRVASRSGQSKVSATFTSLPADFKLTPERKQIATKAGISSMEIDKVFAHFVSTQKGQGTRSPNWDAKWEAWCRNRPNKTTQVKRVAI